MSMFKNVLLACVELVVGGGLLQDPPRGDQALDWDGADVAPLTLLHHLHITDLWYF
jgi:hypothetical protein